MTKEIPYTVCKPVYETHEGSAVTRFEAGVGNGHEEHLLHGLQAVYRPVKGLPLYGLQAVYETVRGDPVHGLQAGL